MAAILIKPIGTEAFCNAGLNTYGNASVLRLYNSNTTAPFLVTRAVNSTVVLGTVTIGPGQEMILVKSPLDVVSSNNALNTLFAAPVAYKGG